MDAWSSPWGDDNVLPDVLPSKPAVKDDGIGLESNAASATFSSLNAFDASDPWSTDAVLPAVEFPPAPDAKAAASNEDDNTPDAEESALRSKLYISANWSDAPSSPVAESQRISMASPSASRRSNTNAETPAATIQKQLLSSHDPWAAESSSASWDTVKLVTSSSNFASDLQPQSTGWPTSEIDTLPHNLEQGNSSSALAQSPGFSPNAYSTAHDVPTQADTSQDRHQIGAGLDVWAAEASSREKKAHRLDREEIDKLKVDARKLISSISSDKETQASFAQPSNSEGSWTDLFGSQGAQRDKLHHLQSPPASLMSSSGALRLHLPHSSPATLDRFRSSIAHTEHRGVKLTSLDNNSSWQKSSRPLTKAEWLPDSLSAEVDSLSLASTNADAVTGTSSTTSGPGWMQTSSNDMRSASGPSFLASFFKGRQASVTNIAAVGSPTVSQEMKARRSTSSIETSSPRTSGRFERYQDTAASKYTDDPSGPDLMSLDTATASASVVPSPTAPPSAPAQGPGLLTRWRNSGLFKSSAKKQNPSWASSSLRRDDLDWLEEQESTDSRIGRYHYDDDVDAEDSFASFQDSSPRAASPPLRTDLAPVANALDPFDNLFSPAIQTSLTSGASPTATSSVRSSLSIGRMSSEGGLMTINTSLGRANNLERKIAASPLQPLPQAQNKRTSIVPPPRVNAASSRLARPDSAKTQTPAQGIADPFADFLSDTPKQQLSNPNAAQVPFVPAKASTPSANGKGGLTADDLLFFDNL